MSYFSRFGIKDSKSHVHIKDFAEGGRSSGKAHEKKVNRRFCRRAGKKMIDMEEDAA